MEYRIIEHQDDIEIFYSDGQKLLHVARRHTWTGKRISKMYRDDKLVLESEYNAFLFMVHLSITYQDLEDAVSLEKRKREFYILYDDNVIAAKFHYFKTPFCVFYNKEERIGELRPENPGWHLPPGQYKAVFERDERVNFYSLLLFSMQLSTYDA